MKSAFITVFLIFSFLQVAADSDSLRHSHSHASDAKDRMHAGVLLAGDLMRTNIDSAFILLKEAAPLASDKDITRRADYFGRWGVYYWYSGDWDKAIDNFREIMAMNITSDNLFFKAMAANNIGTLYNMMGHPDSARKYLNIALQTDIKRDNKQGIYKTKYDLGRMYLRQDQYELALYHLLDVADFQAMEKDTFRLLHTFMVLGNVYTRVDSISKAVDYHLKCVALATAINEPQLLALAYNNLASIYCKKPGELERTVYYAEKGLEIAEENNYHNLLVILNSNAGIAYQAHGQPEKAVAWMNKAYKHIEKATNRSDITNFYIRFGEAHKEAGNYDKAKEYINRGLQMAIAISSFGNQSDAYFQLAAIDSIQGNTKSSLANYKKGVALRDSIWSKEHKSRISELQIIYDTEKKEFEIQELKRRQEVSSLRWQLGILIAVIATVLLLSVIIFLGKQRQISKQQLMLQQKENEKKQAILDANMQELTGKALSLAKSEEIIEKLKQEIVKMLPKSDHNTSHDLKSLLRLLKSNDKNQELWKEFENRFNELNNGFINKLVSLYPELTPAEIRLCAMLRLQLSTKEISEITNRSARTIETTRFKIRKKMAVEASGNLTNYILKI